MDLKSKLFFVLLIQIKTLDNFFEKEFGKTWDIKRLFLEFSDKIMTYTSNLNWQRKLYIDKFERVKANSI
jgi:hypothetical protein